MSPGIQTRGPVVHADRPLARPLLTVIMPVFNEPGTVEEIVKRVLEVPLNLELIIVDDGSSFETRRILHSLDDSRVTVFSHEHNRGKGSAIRTGLAHARGTFTVIQDADLEYDPNDFSAIIGPLRDGDARVVYGSRYLSATAQDQFRPFRYGVKVLNCLVSAIYGQHLSDTATCYKAASTELFRSLELECERFEFCPEVTAKLCRLGIPIKEVGISYQPRSVAEGKKIRFSDGIHAITTYWKHRHWRAEKAASRSLRSASQDFSVSEG